MSMLSRLCLPIFCIGVPIAVSATPITVEYVRIPAPIDGHIFSLEAKVYRPADNKAHPAIVMTHGRLGPRGRYNPDEVESYAKLNARMAESGYAVVFVVRRGYGHSDGPDVEIHDTAVETGLEAVRDVEAGVRYAQAQTYVQTDRVAIMGQSQGGWVAIAASTVPIEGVRVTINLCGGTNYGSMGSGRVTAEVQAHWVEAVRDYGTRARLPMLWLYAENDANHAPADVARMLAAYNGAGGHAELVEKPPYGKNGHYITSAPDLIIDDITGFLTRHDMPPG